MIHTSTNSDKEAIRRLDEEVTKLKDEVDKLNALVKQTTEWEQAMHKNRVINESQTTPRERTLEERIKLILPMYESVEFPGRPK